jgi:hypothetical protein
VELELPSGDVPVAQRIDLLAELGFHLRPVTLEWGGPSMSLRGHAGVYPNCSVSKANGIGPAILLAGTRRVP